MADDADDTPLPDETPATDGKPAMVPSARLRAESALKRAAVAEKAAALQRAEAAEARVKAAEDAAKAAQDAAKDWESKYTDAEKTWSSKVEAAEKTWSAKESSWLEERAILGAGITDAEAIVVARALYDKLPVDGRLPFADQLVAWKAEADNAPKALRAYFGNVQAEAPAKEQTVNKAKASAATGATPGATANVGDSGATLQQMKEAEAALRRGDAGPWNAMKARVLAQLANKQPDPSAKV